MRRLLVIGLALTCLASVGCRRWFSKAPASHGHFTVVSVHRTTAAHPTGEDLIVRVNVLSGESWLLTPTDKDGKTVERWTRIAEPIKEIEEPVGAPR
jgi:hypothetical protein